MFDIGFPELMLAALVALLVIGPERLPEAMRGMGLWLGRLRRSFNAVKTEIEREIGMDDIRRQLHNEAVMEEMKRIENEVKNTANEAKIDPPDPSTKPDPTSTDTTQNAEPSTTDSSANSPVDTPNDASIDIPNDAPVDAPVDGPIDARRDVVAEPKTDPEQRATPAS